MQPIIRQSRDTGGARTGADAVRLCPEPTRIVVPYRHRVNGGEWESEEYAVQIAYTDCHFGGRRPGFLCPARVCERRVAVLYSSGSLLVVSATNLLMRVSANRITIVPSAERKSFTSVSVGVQAVWVMACPHDPKGCIARLIGQWQEFARAEYVMDLATMARFGAIL